MPVLVGGSGLYVRAALDRLEFPGTDPEIRARLEAELERVGPAPLYERLRERDPEAARSILPGNGRRIVRALEVIELSGRPFSATMPSYDAVYDSVQLGVEVPRDVLDERVAVRVERMWAAGLVDEVRELMGRGLAEGRTAAARSATPR
nr:hypothetical protein GCM10020093_104690 [Planobispora longispora]